MNKQSEAISWSRARKARELVGVVQVSGYYSLREDLGRHEQESRKLFGRTSKMGKSLYSCHGWKGKRTKPERVDSLLLSRMRQYKTL